MATTTPGTAVAKADPRRVTLRNLFETQRPELAKLLPRGMDADRLFRMALTECLKNPKLLECTAESWALAIQTCASQGLYPDSGLGYMYLVPRKNTKKNAMEVSAMRGYSGDIRLARNSGEIASIFAEVVYGKDTYKVVKGLDPSITHEPYDGDDDPGALRACYAVAKLTSGEVVFVALAKRDVMRHRAASESAGESWSPWQKHEAAMWRKTAIHELFKWLPKATERAEGIAREIAGERAPSTLEIQAISSSTVPAAPLSGLEGLTASLPEPAAAEPCKHPAVPPSKVAATPKGHTLACPDCGTEFAGEAEERVPGEDDGPDDVKAAVQAIAGAADKAREPQRRIR